MVFNIDFSLPLKDPVLIFSLVLFIILFAPIILRKLRIPSIVGLILAGVIIGPYGFNVLERSDAFVLFGMVGLLYIMFLAGLELDLNEFKQSKYRSIVFGVFTFLIPMVIGIPVCFYFLKYSLISSILISSMFSTHTLIAYPIASRLGVIKNEAVVLTIGGTIITDTLVLIILSIISGSVKGTLTPEYWITFSVSLLCFLLIVLFIFPLIGRWFFKNIGGEKTSHYIFVIGMLFLAAFLAKLAGVEPIIGAFIAGIALNRLIPQSSALMNRISFVGNALFIPFFLISVGMLVDLKILLKGPTALIIAATLTTVALFGKWFAALFTQKIFKYSGNQRRIIFGLSSSHAAATIAVIMVGFRINLVDENILNGTIILILITSFVASFVTENAGRKIAISESKDILSRQDFKEKILIPIANPAKMESLIDLAILLKDRRSKEPLIPFSVVQDDDEARGKIILSNQILEKAVIHASATDIKTHVLTRVDLNVASGISRAIKELMISHIIIGWTEKTKTTEWIFGSILDNLLQNTWQSIIVPNLITPVNTIKKLIVVVPQNAEIEVGFNNWVSKIFLLAGQIGSRITFYCSLRTINYIKNLSQEYKFNGYIGFITSLANWENIEILEKEIHNNDLLIIINARKGTVSYNINMNEVPAKLSKNFQKHNFIILYPEQNPTVPDQRIISKDDLEIEAIQENIERFSRLGKGLQKILKRFKRHSN